MGEGMGGLGTLSKADGKGEKRPRLAPPPQKLGAGNFFPRGGGGKKGGNPPENSEKIGRLTF